MPLAGHSVVQLWPLPSWAQPAWAQPAWLQQGRSHVNLSDLFQLTFTWPLFHFAFFSLLRSFLNKILFPDVSITGSFFVLVAKRIFCLFGRQRCTGKKKVMLYQQNHLLKKGLQKYFVTTTKCLVLSTIHLVAAAKSLVATTKSLFVVSNFVAVTNHFLREKNRNLT